MGRRAGAARAGRVLAGRERGSFLPAGAAREAAGTPRRRRRRRSPNMAALADVTGGCGTAGAGQAPRAPEAAGGPRGLRPSPGPRVSAGQRPLLGVPPCLPPPVSPFSPQKPRAGAPSPGSRGLARVDSGQPRAVPVAPQAPPCSQPASAAVVGSRRGARGPHETPKGLRSRRVERGADGRALGPRSLALQMEQLHGTGLKVDFVFSGRITV